MIPIQQTALARFFKDTKLQFAVCDNRLHILQQIANALVEEYYQSTKVHLHFIDKNNATRSQMAQIWAFFAIKYFQLPQFFSFSGGLQTKAFHRNALNTLRKIGFRFNLINFCHHNPHYCVSFKGSNRVITAFSKTYDSVKTSSPYIAITTCEEVYQETYFTQHATACYCLPYKNPETSDGTTHQFESYLEVCKQIAAEFFIIFNTVKAQIHN